MAGTANNCFRTYNWFGKDTGSFLIIAGPCSAETELQVLNTATELSVINGVSVFRAGVWKPRTRPGNFEGAGNKALKWLNKVQAETGLRVAVEVATPEHVKKCIDANIDVLWIGARTTSNPFSLQVIIDLLHNYDKPVLVKNPVNPDIELWTGAIERLIQAGVTKIGAVLRGCYPFEKTALRNIPKWELAIDLKTRFPDIPILCDPSHIAGDVRYIPEITQQSLDLGFNGLMFESHFSPRDALSDKKQQLKPRELSELLKMLHFRDASELNFINNLERFRNKIDSIDMQLIELLAQRMNIVEEIGAYKNKNSISIFQLKRWKQIIETRLKYGNKLGLDKTFIRQLLKLIHFESIKKQSQKQF